MSLCCVFHKVYPMRVVEDLQREVMVATGEWFKHPNCKTEKELNNEKPIRQQPRKRRSDAKHSSKETGISTQHE